MIECWALEHRKVGDMVLIDNENMSVFLPKSKRGQTQIRKYFPYGDLKCGQK